MNSQIVSARLDGSGGGFKTTGAPFSEGSYVLLLLHIREYIKMLKIYQPDFKHLSQGGGGRSCRCGAELSVHAGAWWAATATAPLQRISDGEVLLLGTSQAKFNGKT